MGVSENPSRQSLIPSFLYTSSMASRKTVDLEQKTMVGLKNPPAATAGRRRNFMIPAPKEGKIEMFSPAYYAGCTAGGMLCCGLTHTAVTPLDIVKCNMQVNYICFFILKHDDSNFCLIVQFKF